MDAGGVGDDRCQALDEVRTDTSDGVRFQSSVDEHWGSFCRSCLVVETLFFVGHSRHGVFRLLSRGWKSSSSPTRSTTAGSADRGPRTGGASAWKKEPRHAVPCWTDGPSFPSPHLVFCIGTTDKVRTHVPCGVHDKYPLEPRTSVRTNLRVASFAAVLVLAPPQTTGNPSSSPLACQAHPRGFHASGRYPQVQ